LKRDPKVPLWDAQQATDAIMTMLAGKTFEQFDADVVLRKRVGEIVANDLPGLRATLNKLLAGI
jgi:hypothetical protein